MFGDTPWLESPVRGDVPELLAGVLVGKLSLLAMLVMKDSGTSQYSVLTLVESLSETGTNELEQWRSKFCVCCASSTNDVSS